LIVGKLFCQLLVSLFELFNLLSEAVDGAFWALGFTIASGQE